MNESQVYLQKSETYEFVEASLFDKVTDEHLALWDTSWAPAMRAHRSKIPISDTPEDSHWNWKHKATAWRKLLGYQSYALVCQGELQGLMLTDDITSARLAVQFGKPLVYVQFVATAPWNRPEIQNPPKYRGVGRVFILAAIQASLDEGYKGRVGLHSLPKAEEFYRDKCGFTILGPDSSHQNLTYYEMTETQADNFRRNH
jgi:hypothetical protein